MAKTAILMVFLLCFFLVADVSYGVREVCRLPVDPGPCKGTFRRFAYLPAAGTCDPFMYGGCRGNFNRFRNKEECEMVCGVGSRDSPKEN